MLENFKQYMLEHVDINEQEWDFMRDRFKSITFKKGEVISHVGDIHIISLRF